MPKFDPEKLLSQEVKDANDPDDFPPGAITDSDDIIEALDMHPDNEFLNSVYDFFEENGFITEKQHEAVLKFKGE